jgi:membrane protease subunit (stomatin/prohibitin family)
MSEKIEFTRNYSDLSTNQGFQFEFYCDRCGNGFRTRFKPSVTGTVTGAMDAASSLFGGIFGQAADLTERVHSANWQKARDDAFIQAMQELKSDFIQCPRCSSWVCKKSCWNARKGLCKECAPDLGVEMAAAQARFTVEKVTENPEIAEEDLNLTKAGIYKENLQAACSSCGAALPGNVKFCPECGAKIQTEAKCPKCGAKLIPGAKFCPECGTKV